MNIENPYPDPKPTPWWRRAWVLVAAAGFLGLVLGFGMGGGSPETVTVEVAGPTVTATPEPVTTTATPEPEVVETERLPQVCFDALDEADNFIMQTGELFAGPVAEMFGAASMFDADALDRELENFNRDADRLLATQARYLVVAGECRG